MNGQAAHPVGCFSKLLAQVMETINGAILATALRGRL
jgi:hypothetical protein